MSPSGAVRAGPPAAQANRTANFNAHEYRIEKTACPAARRWGAVIGKEVSQDVFVNPGSCA